MLISCPNCAAGYDVPDHLLAGAGKRLRCARCAQEWLALPEPEAAAKLAPDIAPEIAPVFAPARPPPIDRPPAPSRQAGNRALASLALAGWVLSIGLLGGIGWGAVHWRSQVMAGWPPSERLYQAVGLD